MIKTCILVPCFNSGELLAETIDSIRAYSNLPIIIVDDGSNLETKEFMLNATKKYLDICCMHLKDNMGKGFAILEGFKNIDDSYDFIITIDSDMQHNPAELHKFINFDTSVDLLIGSRDIAKMPARSKIGNWCTRKLFSFVYKADISDTQSGYRRYSRRLKDLIRKKYSGGRYDVEMESLLVALNSNMSLATVSIDTIYHSKYISFFNPIRDSLLIYKNFIKYSFIGLLCFFLDYSVVKVLFEFYGYDLAFSQLLARLLSSVVNATLLVLIVFGFANVTKIRITQYSFLYAINIFLATFLLPIIFYKISLVMPAGYLFFSKLIIELFLFFVNFNIAKLIFKK